MNYFINGEEGEPLGNYHSEYSPHGVFPCKGDDSWCAIAISNDIEWEKLVEVMGSPDWATSEVYKSSRTRKNEEESINQKLSECTVDWGVLEQPGVTVGLSETPGGSWTPSPGLGQHNQYVLEEILGMNQKDIELLRSSGALT